MTPQWRPGAPSSSTALAQRSRAVQGTVRVNGVQDCREFVNSALERYCTCSYFTSTLHVQVEESGIHLGHHSDPDTYPLFAVVLPA